MTLCPVYRSVCLNSCDIVTYSLSYLANKRESGSTAFGPGSFPAMPAVGEQSVCQGLLAACPFSAVAGEEGRQACCMIVRSCISFGVLSRPLPTCSWCVTLEWSQEQRGRVGKLQAAWASPKHVWQGDQRQGPPEDFGASCQGEVCRMERAGCSVGNSK